MPSSHPLQLNEIIDLVILTDPQKLLDIGVGFGKYGFLAREYLELWNSSNDYLKWTRQIDGIEAFRDYLTPIHRQIYSRIHEGDALSLLPLLDHRYDLILMIDVLEHFSRDDGVKVLELCRRRGRNTIISVPKSMSAQGEVYGNPYETHKYSWGRKDFSYIKEKVFIPNGRSVICYIGEDCKRISSLIRRRKWRRRLMNIAELTGLKKILLAVFKKRDEIKTDHSSA
jgi:hypothetical protein